MELSISRKERIKITYALNLDADSRILSATYDEYAPADQPRVESLPEGDISDYKYVDSEYVSNPLPEPEAEAAEPTTEDDLTSMAIDHEYRITMLELGVTEDTTETTNTESTATTE